MQLVSLVAGSLTTWPRACSLINSIRDTSSKAFERSDYWQGFSFADHAVVRIFVSETQSIFFPYVPFWKVAITRQPNIPCGFPLVPVLEHGKRLQRNCRLHVHPRKGEFIFQSFIFGDFNFKKDNFSIRGFVMFYIHDLSLDRLSPN